MNIYIGNFSKEVSEEDEGGVVPSHWDIIDRIQSYNISPNNMINHTSYPSAHLGLVKGK